MSKRRVMRLMLALGLSACASFAGAHSDTDTFTEPEVRDDQGRADHASAQASGVGQADWPVVAAARSLLVLEGANSGAGIRRVQAFGRVIPSPAAVHDLNAYISGQIREVFVQPGTWVEEGERIASIYSPEFMLTQSAYLALLRNKEQLEKLRGEGRLPNYLRDARENLHWWGMTEQDIEALEARDEPVESLWVRASKSGLITEVLVEPGELINAGDRAMQNFLVIGIAVARIAVDGAPLWLEGYTYGDELGPLRDARTMARVQLSEGKVLERSLAHVAPTVDPDTQLGRFFVELGSAGSDGVAGLALGQLTTVELRVPTGDGVWVPAAAVMAQGLTPIAFVQRDAGHYERRQLQVREEVAGWARVGGIGQDEQVVTRGKMLLEGAFRMGGGGAAASADDHHH